VVGRRDAERDIQIQPIDLTGAALPGANLYGADLSSADLPGAKLGGANLTGAKLGGADLTSARWPRDVLVPGGWKLNTDSGLLEKADTSAGPAEAN
jgi:Pentapeptide repeats (8 copies)